MLTHRLAVVLTVATFLLLLIGGLVHPTGSSLACPDWPLCFGEVFPEMKGGVLVEHSHRLAATAVGLLSIVLCVAIWRSRRAPAERALRRLGLAAVALVIVQGLLGGLTVLLRLPTLVSSLHLAVSMLFLLLVAYLAVRLDPRRSDAGAPLARRLQVAALLAVYLQVLLGALVRHLGAGRVCGGDPWLCAGALWPDFSAGRLQVVHRGMAYLVLGLVLVSAHVAWRRARGAGGRGRGLAARAALATPFLALAQVLLGLFSVSSYLAVPVVVAHTGGAALLLLACFLTVVGLGPWGPLASAGRPERASLAAPDAAGALS